MRYVWATFVVWVSVQALMCAGWIACYEPATDQATRESNQQFRLRAVPVILLLVVVLVRSVGWAFGGNFWPRFSFPKIKLRGDWDMFRHEGSVEDDREQDAPHPLPPGGSQMIQDQSARKP